MDHPIIQLSDVWKIYPIGPGVPALRGIELTVRAGQYIAITGPSGSGKSTMLNILGCLDKPTSGRYFLGGQDVSHMSDNELSQIRNLRIGFVFQSFNLIPWMTVAQNIEVPLVYQGTSRADRHRISAELAARVGLEHRLDHRPTELSGGQRQRIAIARALANDPLVILADEPTGNLDSRTGQEIMSIFDDLNRRGCTIVAVTHEDHIAAHAERMVAIGDGLIESDVATTPKRSTNESD